MCGVHCYSFLAFALFGLDAIANPTAVDSSLYQNGIAQFVRVQLHNWFAIAHAMHGCGCCWGCIFHGGGGVAFFS